MQDKKDLNYWLRQVRKVEKGRVEGAEKTIAKVYKSVLSDLNGFLGNEYAKYSDKDGRLTISILWQKQRYARFLEEVVKRTDYIAIEIKKIILSTVESVYSNCYKGMVKAVRNSSNIKELAEKLRDINVRPEVLKRAVNNPISGLTLTDRLEKNRRETIYNIKKQLNIGLMNGDRYDTVAKKISERIDVSYGKALNTVKTETHRVQESGFNDCAKNISKSIENTGLIYTATWHTRKDERVRPSSRVYTSKGWKTKKNKNSKANHQKMEGVTIKVGDKFDLGNGVFADCPGNSGDAANDCGCRCFITYKLMTYEEYERAI